MPGGRGLESDKQPHPCASSYTEAPSHPRLLPFSSFSWVPPPCYGLRRATTTDAKEALPWARPDQEQAPGGVRIRSGHTGLHPYHHF